MKTITCFVEIRARAYPFFIIFLDFNQLNAFFVGVKSLSIQFLQLGECLKG